MRAVFDSAKVIVDGEVTYLCLAVPPKDARKFVGDMKQGKKYAAELKEHRERRSLDANAYMWQMLGVGWPTELVDYDGDKYVVRAYYGSSQYNTRQMSRIINAVVEDCKEQDIETLTPCEIARLIDRRDTE